MQEDGTEKMPHLSGLNTAQKDAALHITGPLLIVAGAGTGKTRTIVHRISHIMHSGVAGNSILAITFTNKAAHELRERVASTVKSYQTLPLSCTFHSFGVRMLREFGDRLGYTKRFSIADDSDSLSYIKDALKQLGYSKESADPKRIQNIISRWKGEGRDWREGEGAEVNPMYEIAHAVWKIYDALLRKNNSVDFDDLITLPVRLLENHSDIKETLSNRFKYIHVDEYQDTNTIQYRLVKHLSEDHGNICAVGDGDQNIYSWRGAKLRNILNFERDFPGTRVIMLEENYRSTGTILEGATQIIEKNKFRIDRELKTANPPGKPIALYGALSEYDEARFVVETIQGLAARGAQLQEIAVLFRAHFLSRILEETFLAYEVPYRVSGVRFFERKEVKDVIAYLEGALSETSIPPAVLSRIINTPKRGIGKSSFAKILSGQEDTIPPQAKRVYKEFKDLMMFLKMTAERKPLAETLRTIIVKTGMEEMLKDEGIEGLERLDNLKELVTLSSRFDETPGEAGILAFLEHVTLMTDQDTFKDNTQNTVSLMTVHAAKGLEFDHVFIVGLEEGLFPSDRREGEGEDKEEERRLMYVAMTRAKKALYLSYAMARKIFGTNEIRIPSQFMNDIPPHLVEPAHALRTDSDEETIYLS